MPISIALSVESFEVLNHVSSITSTRPKREENMRSRNSLEKSKEGISCIPTLWSHLSEFFQLLVYLIIQRSSFAGFSLGFVVCAGFVLFAFDSDANRLFMNACPGSASPGLEANGRSGLPLPAASVRSRSWSIWLVGAVAEDPPPPASCCCCCCDRSKLVMS